MANLIEIVNKIATTRLDELAEQIQEELKAACPSRTGEARRAIKIEKTSETSRFIGGTNEHLFYADQGNNPTSEIVAFVPYPSWDLNKRPVVSDDGWVVSHGRKGYEGKHFVREVADRHR